MLLSYRAGFAFLVFIGSLAAGFSDAYADEVILAGSESLAQLEVLRGKGSEPLNTKDEKTKKSTETIDDVMSIGQPEDEEDIRKIFLRQSSVLLKAGEKEFELGFTYLSNQLAATIYNARFRQFQFPIAFRIGIIDRLEGSISLPLTHAKQEFSFADEYLSQKASGIGDTSVGINYEIYRETAYWPDIIISLSVRAPTGEKPDQDGLSTGSGHWAGSFGLEFIKTSDPVVLFWGIRYTHEFPATHFINDGIYKVKTGEIIDYNFGFGFAVNDKVSLGTQVSGSYQGESRVDGVDISGTSGEPLSLRSALTYRVSKKTFVEPSLTIGLNNDTADFVIGIAASRRFGD